MERRDLLKGAVAQGVITGLAPAPLVAAGHRQPRGYLRTNWSKYPLALGSYSLVPHGAPQRDRAVLQAPLGQTVFFAGEATFDRHNGTVHAAYNSGLKAAAQAQASGRQRVAIMGAGMAGLAAAKALAEAGIETVTTDDSYVLRGPDMPSSFYERIEVEAPIGAGDTEVNYGAYFEQSDYGGAEVVFAGGYAQILETLRGGYEMRLGQNVRRIDHSREGVSLAVGAERLAFDALIVTVSLGVLKGDALAFEPALPRAKRAVIDRLGMGLLDKVVLQFDDVFWERDVSWIYTPNGRDPDPAFALWLNLWPSLEVPVLVGFHGGPTAHRLAGWTDAAILDASVERLSAAYPA